MNQHDDRISLTNEGIVARLKSEIFPEAGGFVARCPGLRISAQGENRKEAGEALGEALQVYLSDLIENATLDAVLVGELGWQRLPASPDWRLAFSPPAVEVSTLEIGPLPARA